MDNKLRRTFFQSTSSSSLSLFIVLVFYFGSKYGDASAVSRLSSSTNNFQKTILVNHPSQSHNQGSNATVGSSIDLLERRHGPPTGPGPAFGQSRARGLFSAFKIGPSLPPQLRRTRGRERERDRPRYVPSGPLPGAIPISPDYSTPIRPSPLAPSPRVTTFPFSDLDSNGEIAENYVQSDGPSSSIFNNYFEHEDETDAVHPPLHSKYSHPCYRRCSSDPGSAMTCTYDFVVANYFALSPHCFECPNVTSDCFRKGCLPIDGRPRAVAVVNKMMPGPSIRVCQGDTIVVDVQNKLVGQETTIHWHGLHQAKTPWMDGVPHLTQCPIPQGTTFRYQFEVPKAGTYFWHSHDGLQRADGVFGKLIIRKPVEEDVQAQYYDYDLAEHEIIVWDWLYNLAITGHLVGHVTDQREKPRSILVNGLGFPPKFFNDFRHYDTIQSRRKPFVPVHQVRISQGYSYRFRLISNGIALCPIEFSIENHPLLVISSDGYDLAPVLVNSLVIQAGERYDFVVRGDGPPGSYWMKYRGHIDCGNGVNATRTFQLGVLNYEEMPYGALPLHTIRSWEAAGPQPSKLVDLNPVNEAPGIPGESVTVAELSSVYDDDPEILTQEYADHQFYLSYDFNPVPNVNFGKPAREKGHRSWLEERVRSVDTYLPQLNFISHAMPLSPPLIQPETINSLDRCNAESKRAQGVDCTKQHCKCTHWLKVQHNSIVEVILVDMGVQLDANHPFHLHGHSFRVMAIERVGNTTSPEIIQQWDEQGLLPRRRINAPIKDTVQVPDGGYTILRWRANNPGFWFFHCHLEFHAERGMALIFQVGNKHEIPRAPSHFPTCGNYLPPIKPALSFPQPLYEPVGQYSHQHNTFTRPQQITQPTYTNRG